MIDIEDADVTAADAILSRLEAGRPLILGGDPTATLRARGIPLDGDAPLGRLVRESPLVVADHYDHEIASGVDVIAALTADTMPRALLQIGMAFRAAALTGAAVDLAQESAQRAPRPVAVAGVLGARWIAPTQPDRIAEEYARHAARLAASECEILLARGWVAGAGRSPAVGTIPPPSAGGMARLTRRAAIVSGSSTHLPTWAVIEVGAGLCTPDREPLDECAHAAVEGGASLLLLEAPSFEIASGALQRVSDAGVPIGVLLAAAGALAEVASGSAKTPQPEGVAALSQAEQAAEAWAQQAKRLVSAGARAIGGGAGVSARYIAALSRTLGRSDRSSIWPRAM